MHPRKIELRVGQVCSMLGVKLTGNEINAVLGIEKEKYHCKYSLSDVRNLRLKLKKPKSAAPIVVAIHSRCTGAGKTVLAANLGASFAWKGLRVLIIDGDASGDLSNATLPDFKNRRNIDIVDVMRGEDLSRAIKPVYEDGMLDILPSSQSLTVSDVHMTLGESSLYEFKEWRLNNAPVLSECYDVIIIDTNSYPTRLTYTLLLGSDVILNVVKMTSHAVEESKAIRDFYTASEQYISERFPDTMSVANGVQSALANTESILLGLADLHAGQLCDVVIPLHAVSKAAPKFVGIIAEKEPGSYAAQCFFSMAENITKKFHR